MLTIYYFAMLGVGFPASIKLSCQAKGTTFTEFRTQDTFLWLWPFLAEISSPNQTAWFFTLFLYRA
jgi:hypothetical protein